MSRFEILAMTLVVALVLPGAGHAAGIWRGEAKIIQLDVNNDWTGSIQRSVMVTFDNAVTTNSCAYSQYQVVLNGSVPDYGRLYALLLGAYLADKSVDVWIKENDCDYYRSVGSVFKITD